MSYADLTHARVELLRVASVVCALCGLCAPLKTFVPASGFRCWVLRFGLMGITEFLQEATSYMLHTRFIKYTWIYALLCSVNISIDVATRPPLDTYDRLQF